MMGISYEKGLTDWMVYIFGLILNLFLQQVSHGAIQFTAYEELRKIIVDFKEKRRKSESADNLLVQSSSSL